MKDQIKEIIGNMYEDKIPMHKLFTVPKEFKIPKTRMAVMLFAGQPETKEDSDLMEKQAMGYVNLMLAVDVLHMIDEEKGLVGPGREFVTFIEEAKKYLDSDNIIIRVLGISRQDFDACVKEYTEAVSGAENIDEIIDQWADLSNDEKLCILRGVFLQRSIMANILIDFKNREQNSVNFGMQTIQMINNILGGDKPDDKAGN